jgi:GcrA cell cycle regulator
LEAGLADDEWTWTAEREELLRQRWAEKLRLEETIGKKQRTISAATIADELGTSRSACLGKLNRLGLLTPTHKRQLTPPLPKPKPKRVNGSPAPSLAPRPSLAAPIELGADDRSSDPTGPIAPAEIPFEPAPEGGVTLEQLHSGACRWPIGNPLDWETFRFCGEPKRVGSVYCETHHKVAYVPNTKKARLAPRT